MGNTAGKLDNIQAALNIAARIGEGLAVFARQQFRQVVELALRQFEEAEQNASAALRVGGGPSRLRCRGHGDRLLDLGALSESNFGLRLSGIGIEHVGAAAGLASNRPSANEMADLPHPRPSWYPALHLAASDAARIKAQGAAGEKRKRPSKALSGLKSTGCPNALRLVRRYLVTLP
jgi:hypothetical protein